MIESLPINCTGPVYALIDGESRRFASLAEKFEALAEVWDDYNIGRSITSFDHPAYHQIIGMGEKAIPLLMARLRQGDSNWIYALKCITGGQVDTKEMHGDAERVVQAWIEWGDKLGI